MSLDPYYQHKSKAEQDMLATSAPGTLEGGPETSRSLGLAIQPD